MQRHRRDLEILSEMNLTNLIDTAFILLIAFILVAPAIKHGIDLELPYVEKSGHIEAESRTVTIAIRRDPLGGDMDWIYVEDQRLDMEQLRDLIVDKQSKYEQLDVLVEADKLSTYNTLAQVMAEMVSLGISNLGFVTAPTAPEPEEEKP